MKRLQGFAAISAKTMREPLLPLCLTHFATLSESIMATLAYGSLAAAAGSSAVIRLEVPHWYWCYASSLQYLVYMIIINKLWCSLFNNIYYIYSRNSSRSVLSPNMVCRVLCLYFDVKPMVLAGVDVWPEFELSRGVRQSCPSSLSFFTVALAFISRSFG